MIIIVIIGVILSPTKELALQTVNVMEKLTQMMPNIVCGNNNDNNR